MKRTFGLRRYAHVSFFHHPRPILQFSFFPRSTNICAIGKMFACPTCRLFNLFLAQYDPSLPKRTRTPSPHPTRVEILLELHPPALLKRKCPKGRNVQDQHPPVFFNSYGKQYTFKERLLPHIKLENCKIVLNKRNITNKTAS